MYTIVTDKQQRVDTFTFHFIKYDMHVHRNVCIPNRTPASQSGIFCFTVTLAGMQESIGRTAGIGGSVKEHKGYHQSLPNQFQKIKM